MKKIKKFAACAFAVLAACVMLIANPQDAKAYTYDLGIQEVGATTTTATIKWNPVAGASYYIVSTSLTSQRVTATTATVAGIHAYTGDHFGVVVEAYDANGDDIGYDYEYVNTKPVVSYVGLYDWKPGTNAAQLKLLQSNYDYPDGYNIEVLNVKGKLIYKKTASYSSYVNVISAAIKNKGFSVRIQPFYANIASSKATVLGDWTGWKTIVPQPKVTSTRGTKNWSTKKKNFTIKWKKVSGAKTYSVYRATSKDGKYKKVATVKGTSLKQNNMKYSQTYYYKVVANKVPVVVNGKKRKVSSYVADSFYYSYVY